MQFRSLTIVWIVLPAVLITTPPSFRLKRHVVSSSKVQFRYSYLLPMLIMLLMMKVVEDQGAISTQLKDFRDASVLMPTMQPPAFGLGNFHT